MSEDSRVYRVVDLFSGAGGLSLGFDHPDMLAELPGLDYGQREFPHVDKFETVFCAELDDYARETFKTNFNLDEEETVKDITERTISDWEALDADLIIGGPPCQGFSLLNQKKTVDIDDDRNGLWNYYMDAVEGIEPEMFLIENVPRFLDTNEGLGAVRRAQSLGYDVVVNRLWAHDYGVPQERQRAFVIGRKSTDDSSLPFFPKATVPEEESLRTVEDAIGGLMGYYNAESNQFSDIDVSWHKPRRRHQITLDRIRQVPKNGGSFDREELLETHPDLVPNCWRNTDGFTDSMGRLRLDEPSVTIRTGFYDPMKGRYVHPTEDRVLTPREGARLQTFPDEFEFVGPKTKVARQIGNAVPPKFAAELATAIYYQLQGASSIQDPDKTATLPFSEYIASRELSIPEMQEQVNGS